MGFDSFGLNIKGQVDAQKMLRDLELVLNQRNREELNWDCLSQTIPTTLPTIPYPRYTLPQHSQPRDGPFSITRILYPFITTFCDLVTLLSLVSLSPLFFIVLIVLPPVTLYTYPRYLGSSSCTHYPILDITNAPLTCSSVSCLSSLSPGGPLLSVVVLRGWVSSSQLWLSLAPILLLT